MPSSHSLDRIAVTFDDENLVANAGLLAPATLAERLGLRELLDETVDLGDVAGHANVGAKAMTVIHSVLAGADSIDDCDVLRAGATSTVLGHPGGPLDDRDVPAGVVVGSQPSARLGVEGDARPGVGGAGAQDRAAPFTIDVASSVHETYGLQKEGATRFSYTQVRGYHPLWSRRDNGCYVAPRIMGQRPAQVLCCCWSGARLAG